MFPEIVESVHQGIPVLTRSCPGGPLMGTLHLGVGMRDETVDVLGVTHLLEHLVCRRLGEPPVDHNAHTEADTLAFWATGTPEQVARHLTAVGRALADVTSLSEAELEREKKILVIEMTEQALGFEEGLLGYRFGAAGPGLVDLGAPTLAAIDRQTVVEWARRWATAANAVLTFTGPVPDGLDVRLPPGEPVVRCVPAVAGADRPALVSSSKGGVAFSLEVGTDSVETFVAALAHEVTTTLRMRDGLVYAVETWVHRLDTGTWVCSFVLDPLPGDESRTAARLVELLRSLVDGFSAEAVEFAASSVRTDLRFIEGAAVQHLQEVAVDRLRGRGPRTLETLTERTSTLTAAELSLQLAAALATVQVTVPDSVETDDPVLSSTGLRVDPFWGWDVHAPEAVDGPVFRSKRLGGEAPAGLRLRVGEKSLTIRDGDTTRSVVLDDVVLVGRRPSGEVVMLDRHGRVARLDPSDWRHGDRLAAELLARIDPALVRPFPAEDLADWAGAGRGGRP